MGRLFWKFFLAILLAQVAATLGVGAFFWVRSQAQDLAHAGASTVETGMRASATLDAAAVAFKHGDVAGLRDFSQTGLGANLIVLDAAGRDLQARAVAPAVRAEAQRLLGTPASHAAVRSFVSNSGEAWTAFVIHGGIHGIHGGGHGGFGDGPPAFKGAPPLFGGVPLAGKPSAGPDAGPLRGGDYGPRIPYIGIVIGILASFLFAAVLAWYISRPIRALRNAFAAAASGDLAPRFADAKGAAGRAAGGKGDELVELGPEFDRMSAKLRALMDNQQRLLHDVSHELRSPLARLQAAIGLAHQNPDKLASSLERIERESVRMDQLVGELLTLSRLDAAINLPPLEEVAIGELLHQIATEADFEAELCGRRVQLAGLAGASASASVIVRGAPDLLWRGIENIVRNAIKYSPPGGVVEIELQQREAVAAGATARVLIDVRDRGPGVAEAHLASIFQAFFRAEPGANNVDGHGLGLAIAQRVILAHGGALAAHNRVGGGLCVSIELPCAGPAGAAAPRQP